MKLNELRNALQRSSALSAAKEFGTFQNWRCLQRNSSKTDRTIPVSVSPVEAPPVSSNSASYSHQVLDGMDVTKFDYFLVESV